MCCNAATRLFQNLRSFPLLFPGSRDTFGRMKRFLAVLALCLVAAPGLAQERVPDFQDSQLVPDPIPAHICVEVHWTEKSDSWHEGWAMHFHYPPLSFATRAAMEKVRAEGKAVLVRCSAANA